MKRLLVLVPFILLILTACQGIPTITPTPTVENDQVVEARLIEQVKSGLTEPAIFCSSVSTEYADSMAAAFSTLLADPNSQRFSLDERVEILNKAIRQIDEELAESSSDWVGRNSGYIALEEGGTDQDFLITLRVNCIIGSHHDPGSRVYIYNEAGESWQVGHLTYIREIYWLGDGWIVFADTLDSGLYDSAIWHIRQSDGEWVNNILIETFPFLVMDDLQVEDDFHRLTVSSHAAGGLCSVPTDEPTDPFAIITGSRQHTFELVDEDYELVDTEIVIEEVYFTHDGERIESDWLEQHWQDLCENWTQP